MHFRTRFIFIFLLPLALLGVEFTPQEQSYIDTKRVINVHTESSWAPFSYVKNGKPQGYIHDLKRLFAERTGLHLDVKVMNYNDAIQALISGKIDLMFDLGKHPKYEKTLIFSNYVTYHYSEGLISRTGLDSLEKLSGKRVGYIEGLDHHIDLYPNINFVAYKDEASLIRAIVNQNIEAAIDSYASLKHFINRLHLVNDVTLRLLPQHNDALHNYHVAARKNQKILMQIINKSITSEDIKHLQEKWDLIDSTLHEHFVEKKQAMTVEASMPFYGWVFMIGFVYLGVFLFVRNWDTKQQNKILEAQNEAYEKVLKSPETYTSKNYGNSFLRHSMKNELRKYAYGIGILLLFFIFSGVLFLHQYTMYGYYGEMINRAGKQRMFSQRLIVEANHYFNHPSEDHKKNYTHLIQQMDENHQWILKNIHEFEKPYYYNDPGIDTLVQNFLDLNRQFLDYPIALYYEVIKKKGNAISYPLDEVVTMHTQQYYKIYDDLKNAAWLNLAVLAILVFLLWRFLFRSASIRLRDVFDQLFLDSSRIANKHIPTSLTDLKGKIISVSHAYCLLNGYSREELLGKTHGFLRHPGVPKKFYEKMWEKLLKDENWEGEIKNVRKDGSIYWTYAVISPQYDSNGKKSGYYALHKDITNEKLLDKARQELTLLTENQGRTIKDKVSQLHQQNSILKHIINNIPARVFWKDRDFTYLGCNKLFAKDASLAGEEELIGKTDYDMVWKNEADKYRLDDEEVMDRAEPKLNIIEPQTQKDGRQIWINTSKVPLKNEEGEVYGILGVYLDVTKQKEYEQVLQDAKEHAELASAHKSQFLANMSHEIRTPMHGIIGLAHLLKRTDLDTRQGAYLEKLIYSSTILLGILNDILDVSKVEAGKLELEAIPFSIRSVLDTTLSLFSQNAQQKGVTLEVKTEANLPEHLIGDPQRIGQIINNLVSNAIKFTHQGSVTISVHTTKIDAKHIHLYVSVEDTGIGIDSDKTQVLFEAFEQTDSSNTRKYGGTGLGLTISKELVHLMGGELNVESKAGQGSRFSFDVIVGSSETLELFNNDEHKTFEADNYTFEGTVLVAEDHDVNQMVIKATLESLGLTCVIAKDGEEALDKALNESYDLIFMDIQMPKMDGLIVTQKIRESGSTVPIVGLSAAAFFADKQKALASGMDDYMAKPFNEDKLIETLDHYLKKHTNVDKTAKQKTNDKIIVTTKQDKIDIDVGLKYVGGDEKLYVLVLEKFLEVTPSVVDKIILSMEVGDSVKTFQEFHALKGSAAILGAETLSEFAKVYERQFKEERVTENISDIKDALLVEIEAAYEAMQLIIESIKEGQR